MNIVLAKDIQRLLQKKKQNPTSKAWAAFCDDIKNGFVWNLCVMDSLQEGEVTTEHRIVDFHSIHTVPRAFLDALIAERGVKRLRLLPPYREHLSQSFAKILYEGRAARSHNQGLVNAWSAGSETSRAGALARALPLALVKPFQTPLSAPLTERDPITVGGRAPRQPDRPRADLDRPGLGPTIQ
jgi:hypothetical protein